MSVPNKVVPEKNCTATSAPAAAVEVAVIGPVKGAEKLPPLAGLLMLMFGGVSVGLEVESPGRLTEAPAMAVPVPLGSPNSCPLEKPSPSESKAARAAFQRWLLGWNAMPKGLRAGGLQA